jgi:type II secretory pathway pseudopilin PulG
MFSSFKEKRKEGFALIATIIIVAVALFAIAAGLFAIQRSNVSAVVSQAKSMQAYYLARSGAAAVAEWIKAHPNNVKDIIGKSSSPVTLKPGSVGKVTVSVEASVTNNGTMLIIISTGTVNDAKETLRLRLVKAQSGFKFTKAIIAKSLPHGVAGGVGTGGIEYQGTQTLKIAGGGKIDGGVVSIADVNISGGANISGGVISKGNINISGGANISGGIIATKGIKTSGGGNITG